MTYPEYKTAAERHLETCLELVTVLEKYKQKEQNQGLTNNETKDKNKLLEDLYYLTGYIIECSYSCAIYHKIGWTGRVDRLNFNSTSYQISCFPDVRARFSIRRDTRGTGIRQHQLSGNMHFFQTIVPITPTHPIPLIIDDITHRICLDLFDSWNAEVRYVIDSSLILDYDNVFDFVYLAVEVYVGLLKNSLLPA